MTTATKPTSASATLSKLERDRDKAHAKARGERGRVQEHDAETQRLRGECTQHRTANPEQYEGADARPKDGTAAAKLRDKTRKRMDGPNPHAESYAAELANFHAADALVQAFRTEHVCDLIAELDPEVSQAGEEIVEGWEMVLRASQHYIAARERIRAIVISTPRLTGQDLTYDTRPEEWVRQARDVLDGGIASPGLTPPGSTRWTRMPEREGTPEEPDPNLRAFEAQEAKGRALLANLFGGAVGGIDDSSDPPPESDGPPDFDGGRKGNPTAPD